MKTNGRRLQVGLILTLKSVLVWCAAVPQTQYTADIVLPCDYALLDSSVGGLGFTRQKVTLVLQNVTVMGEEPTDALPDYQPPENPDMTVFLATVDLAPLSFAERLLHVECGDKGQEVECEISPIYSQLFIAHIRLPELSIAVMAKAASPIEAPDELANDKVVVPMSVELLVSSSPPSQKISLSDEVTLHCDVWGGTDVSVDWHLQKDGTGHRLNLDDSRITIQKGTQEKKEASSLTIRRLNVHDEGTYICVVSSGKQRLQQILQLQIREPPQVTVSVTTKPKTTVTCHTDRYYPLDVEVSWLLNGSPLTQVSQFTSSHRRNHDGTYSVSSFLEVSVPQSGAAHDTYTCTVSHVSMTDPVTIEAHVLPAQTDVSYTTTALIGFFTIIILSILLLWKHSIRRQEKKTI